MVLRRGKGKTTKAEGPPAGGPSVGFDVYDGDPSLPRLRAALDAGDPAPVAAAYEAATPDGREVIVHGLTLALPAARFVERWPDEDPDRPVAHLLRGAQRIGAAWAARGSGRADTVQERAWEVFFDGLRAAEQDLRRGTELDDDGVGWSTLLVSGRGLQLTVDELRARYARSVAAAPSLAFAADHLLQSLCAKWSGSDADMFAFARAVADEVPDGDPRLRLIPTAHLERAIGIADRDERGRYVLQAEVQQEILDAAERSVFHPEFGDGGEVAQHQRTLNTFAVALCYFQRPQEARPLLEAIGSAPTSEPWAMFGNGAGTVFADFRAQAGLG